MVKKAKKAERFTGEAGRGIVFLKRGAYNGGQRKGGVTMDEKEVKKIGRLFALCIVFIAFAMGFASCKPFFTGTEAATVAAVLAGNDMLCCTDFEVQLPAVIAAVKDGRISEEQIDASVRRILKWKAQLGLLEE